MIDGNDGCVSAREVWANAWERERSRSCLLRINGQEMCQQKKNDM